MADLGDKAVAALARHEVAQQQAASLTQRIGACLGRCSISKKLDDPTLRNYRAYYDDATGKTKTHLWQAFREKVECDSGYGMRLLDDEEIHEQLHPRSSDGCRHCFRAWRLVQQRKAIKREIGICRRIIRQLGKSALREVEHAR